MPIKLFTDAEILDADEVNLYFMDQALIYFETIEERDESFGGSGKPQVKEGRLCYIAENQTIYIYQINPITEVGEWNPQLAEISPDTIGEFELKKTTGEEAVVTSAIRNLAVTEGKIANSAVTSIKLAGNLTLTNPTLTTPSLGAATATSLNKVNFTEPSTTATLTLANNSTLTTVGSHSVTLTSLGPTNVTLPLSGSLISSTGLAVVSESMINYTTVPKQTVSTGIPSGGKQHDIWIRVSA